MNAEEIAAVLAKPISQQLLNSNIPARLAYTGLDGAPRVIPLGFHFDGSNFLIGTVPHSAKVKALAANPKVAITIDTTGAWPPRALLVRGSASLETVDGVPEDYLAGGQKLTPAGEFEGWKAGVLALYRQLVRITITPGWAKLLDFETTIPQAVEDLVTGRGTGQGTGRA